MYLLKSELELKKCLKAIHNDKKNCQLLPFYSVSFLYDKLFFIW